MTEDDARRFAGRIGERVEEMSALDDRDGSKGAFSFVFFPMVGPVKGERL